MSEIDPSGRPGTPQAAQLPPRRPSASPGTPQACTTIVRGGDTWHPTSEPCGKKAKGALADGSPACGIHLRSERLAMERADRSAEWKARIDAVNAALGIRAYGWDIGRSVYVSLDDLERLAHNIGDAGAHDPTRPQVGHEGPGHSPEAV